MPDNIFIRNAPARNIHPDKEYSTKKIRGTAAIILALDRAIRYGNGAAESVYDSQGSAFHLTFGVQFLNFSIMVRE